MGGHADRFQAGFCGCHQQPEHPVVEEPQQPARGVEEVESVSGRRGIDDEHVEAPAVMELEQLLHGHVLLGAPERPGDVAIEPVVEDRLGLLRPTPRYDRSPRRRLPWCRASAPTARRGRQPVSTRRGSLDSSSSPRASASRFAGSIVTTQAFRPRRAPSRAIAAAHVVLPTPPGPAQITTRLADASSLKRCLPLCCPADCLVGRVTGPPRMPEEVRSSLDSPPERSGQPLDVGEAELGAEYVGQVELRERKQLGQTGHLAVLEVLAVPAEIGCPERCLPPRVTAGEVGQHLGRDRLGQVQVRPQPIDDDRCELDRGPVL